jgi:hypothetical protein
LAEADYAASAGRYMRKLYNIICDKCRTIIHEQNYPTHITKKGDTLHFCSQRCKMLHTDRTAKNNELFKTLFGASK